jgi:hypothetical protein
MYTVLRMYNVQGNLSKALSSYYQLKSNYNAQDESSNISGVTNLDLILTTLEICSRRCVN